MLGIGKGVLDTLSEKVEEQQLSDLNTYRRQLGDVEDEITTVSRELEELYYIETVYANARTNYLDLHDIRVGKLVSLEGMADKSNSAKTYSVGLRNRLCGISTKQKIDEFLNVGSVIKANIKERVDKLDALKKKQSYLDGQVYMLNISINGLI